jgi:hypothetical protein
MKKAKIGDDQGVVSCRSRRLTAAITDDCDFASVPSSLGAHVNPSYIILGLPRGLTRNERLGRSYSLVTLLAA